MRAALALVQEKTAANRSPRHGQRKHAHHSREMETPAVARAHVQPQHPSTAGALGRTAVECTEKQCRENSACICVCVCVCVCVCMCACVCVVPARTLPDAAPSTPRRSGSPQATPRSSFPDRRVANSKTAKQGRAPGRAPRCVRPAALPPAPAAWRRDRGAPPAPGRVRPPRARPDGRPAARGPSRPGAPPLRRKKAVG